MDNQKQSGCIGDYKIIPIDGKITIDNYKNFVI